jgi:DNA-binding MarR family transcriptional regulator
MSDSQKLTQISILWMHLDVASFLISTERERELKKHNLSSTQMKILLILNYLGQPLTIREVGRWIVRGHTSISLITDKMAGKGLVKKYQDDNNKNQTLVSITRKGKQTLYRFIPRQPIPDILSVLSEEESNHLVACLKKIIKQAENVIADKRTPDLEELNKMLTAGTRRRETE